MARGDHRRLVRYSYDRPSDTGSKERSGMSTSRAALALWFLTAAALTIVPAYADEHPALWWSVTSLLASAVAVTVVLIVRHWRVLRDVWSNR
jgi:hypothetical protein